MNQNVQPHSGAWVTFTYASFSASAFMVAIGVYFLPLDLWEKGYLSMGIVMLVQSCVTLTKTVRDMHESGKLYAYPQRRFLDFRPPSFPKPLHCRAILPQRCRRVGQRPVGHVDIDIALGIEHPDATEIARVAADQEFLPLVALGDPRAQCTCVVTHAINDEPLPLNAASDHR